jgi:uncharacterized protein YbbK (DUF523 family)
MPKPKIGLSRCLVGDRVRYDGQIKAQPDFYTELSMQCEWVPFCPEVNAGMGVPRPPIQIVEDNKAQHLFYRDSPNPTEDFAELIASQVDNHIELIEQLSGFILMQRSPSCGITSTPVFNTQGEQLKTGAGLFVQRLRQLFPDLPIEEAQHLEQRDAMMAFIKRAQTYQLRASLDS